MQRRGIATLGRVGAEGEACRRRQKIFAISAFILEGRVVGHLRRRRGPACHNPPLECHRIGTGARLGLSSYQVVGQAGRFDQSIYPLLCLESIVQHSGVPFGFAGRVEYLIYPREFLKSYFLQGSSPPLKISSAWALGGSKQAHRRKLLARVREEALGCRNTKGMRTPAGKAWN